MRVDVNVKLDDEDIRFISLNSVIDACCKVFKVSRDEFMCRSRAAKLCEARFAAYYLGYLFTKNSLPNIGRYMGRDHTTIMHGRNQCLYRMKSDMDYAKKVQEAKEIAFENDMMERVNGKRRAEEIKKQIKEILERNGKDLEKTGIASREEALIDFFHPAR